MKILFETGSTCVGGAERVVLRIAQAIRRNRPNWQLGCVVLCDRGGLEDEYRQTFPTMFDGPLNYRETGCHLASIARGGHYDVVHCIDSFEHTSFAAWQCPQIAFLQNVFPNVAKSPFAPSNEWLNDKDNPYCAIVTEFQANLNTLPRPGRRPHALRSIPNGIDTDFWCPDETADRHIDVLWCARTDSEKGIGIALALIPLLCDRGIKYGIVTSEPDGPADILRQEAINRPNFNWFSRLSPIELRAFYQSAKLFIQTSSVEGMPATPLEAAACGCFPLCSAVDGVAEVFGSQCRFLLPPQCSPDDWAFAITRVLTNPIPARYHYLDNGGIRERIDLLPGWVWPSLGLGKARQWIVDNYSAEKMTDSYIALYEELVAG